MLAGELGLICASDEYLFCHSFGAFWILPKILFQLNQAKIQDKCLDVSPHGAAQLVLSSSDGGGTTGPCLYLLFLCGGIIWKMINVSDTT